MNERLIVEWNARVKPEDIVYHLGDFCTKGMAYGVPSVKSKAQQYEERLNGKIIHIRGNHDKNNGVKGQCLESAIMELAHFTVMLIHVPPQHLAEIPDFVDFVLCGHVHDCWKEKVVGDTLLINVGVDARNYRPMNMREVIVTYARKRKEYNLET